MTTTDSAPATSLPLAGRAPWLPPFLLLSWGHMLALTGSYLNLGLPAAGLDRQTLFHLCAWALYSGLYLAPVFIVARLTARWRKVDIIGTLLTSVACLLLIAVDSIIYNLYRFHINGFVLNLVFTPGGLDSLGGDSHSLLSATKIVLRVVAVQTIILLLARRLGRGGALAIKLRHGALAGATLLLIQGAVYGLSDISKYGPVLDSAHVYPFFQRIRFRTLAGRLGIAAQPRRSMRAEVDTSRLHYPRAPMAFSPPENAPNIIVLVAESLRWDQLTPDIMPNTWAFAARHNRFTNHYSSGNGTRESLFGMFYGLYGAYWENFLTARRSPLLMDRIQGLGYRLDLRTSARFTYPEFDKTLFANVDPRVLQEADSDLPPWQRDRQNTNQLIQFLGTQGSEKPFFSFFFLESTHASYSFPANSAVRKPYVDALDYANLSLEALGQQRTALINRYSNAAHWVDTQLGRIYRALEDNNLLANTIVVVTGDHGEEFLEHGAWGHNSSFVQQQTRVPLVVAMPGAKPDRVDRLTSHVDIASTLLQTLGAKNALDDFSLGRNLFDASPRDFVAMSDWHSIAVLTDSLKYRIPYIQRGRQWQPKTPVDTPLPPARVSSVLQANRGSLLRAIKNCTRFSDAQNTQAVAAQGTANASAPDKPSGETRL